MTDAPLRRWRDRWTAHYEVWQTLGGEPIWLITTTHSERLAERAAAAWEARPPARDGPSVLSDEERALLRELGAALVAEHGPEGLHFGTRIRRRAGLDPQIIDRWVSLGMLSGFGLISFVLKTVLPAHVWPWGVAVCTLGMMLMVSVWIWRSPSLPLDTWTPAWDGTEDDDG